MKADFEKIADLSGILEQMKNGTPPWVRDWNDPYSRHLPYNVTTMKDDPNQTYRGSNVITLWGREMKMGYPSNGWITGNALFELGGNPITLPDNFPHRAKNKTGQSKMPIINAKPQLRSGVKETTEGKYWDNRYNVAVDASDAFFSMPRVVGWVYNLAQVENLPDEYQLPQTQKPGTQSEAEQMLRDFPVEEKVSHNNHNYYSPSEHAVYIVSLEYFNSEDAYYRTRFHEYGHATGHKSLLDRELQTEDRKKYAFEELIAEITSAFISARFGIPGVVQHASYLSHYCDILADNPKAIFEAASEARKASELILSYLTEQRKAA